MSKWCTPSIEKDLVDLPTFQAWKDRQTTAINNITNNVIPTKNDYDNLVLIGANVNAYYNCVEHKNSDASNVQTNIATLQSTLDDLETTIEERTKDVGVAADRAALTRSPELTRSNYDGWFPIGRPFKHYTVPVLLGLSLFLATMTLFYFLSVVGIHTNFIVHLPQTYSRYGRTHVGVVGNRPFWMMTGVAIILLTLTIYGFTK
jgi:hypothetical protein